MKKIHLLFDIIFKSKKIYNRPKKCDILIYDAVHPEIFLDLFSKYKIDELNIRLEKKINLLIFVITIFKYGFKNIIFNYAKEHIVQSKPKIVITLTDTDLNFYKFKKFFSKIIFISVQYAYRRIHYPDIFPSIINNKIQDLECDYIFCFGKKVSEIYKKLIKCETIIIGSLRNNSYLNFSKEKKDKKRVGFISQFREKNLNRGINHISGINRDDFYIPEKKTIPLVENFCKKNNYDLYIIGASLAKNNNEYHFFKSIIGTDDGFTYLKPSSYENSYMNASNCDIIVFIDSTLGYEMLARGKRAICVHSRPTFYKVENNFGWPAACKKKGFFWTDENNFNEILRILENVNKCSDSIWINHSQFVNNEIISFNKHNSILLEKIDEILQNKINEN